MYRDGSNWKTGAQVIFAGRITRDEISMILNARYDDGWFIPGQVGMTDLQEGWDSQLDHPFHEICGFELTLAAPDDPREISQFVREFTSVKWKKRYRSEEHTSELPSLMRISYAVFCLNKQQQQQVSHNSTMHIFNRSRR